MTAKYTTNFNASVGTVVTGENNITHVNQSTINNPVYNDFSQAEINLMKEIEAENPGLLAKIGNKAIELGVDFSAKFCAELFNQ